MTRVYCPKPIDFYNPFDWLEAGRLWNDGFDTQDIAIQFEMPEAQIYERLEFIKIIGRARCLTLSQALQQIVQDTPDSFKPRSAAAFLPETGNASSQTSGQLADAKLPCAHPSFFSKIYDQAHPTLSIASSLSQEERNSEGSHSDGAKSHG